MKRADLLRILAVVGGAIVIVVALVVANQSGHHSSKPSASNIQLDSINEMLSGIPQKGIELGNPKAKVTLSEFADPQCAWCGKWAREELPSLIQNYVRTGRLRIEFMGLAFVGDDSNRLLRLAQAAGLQNKLWNVVELEYENQGTENSGYATDPFMKAIAEAVRDLDVNKALATWNTNAVMAPIASADALNTKVFGKYSTPSFVLQRTGSKQIEKIPGFTSASELAAAIDAQLKK